MIISDSKGLSVRRVKVCGVALVVSVFYNGLVIQSGARQLLAPIAAPRRCSSGWVPGTAQPELSAAEREHHQLASAGVNVGRQLADRRRWTWSIGPERFG